MTATITRPAPPALKRGKCVIMTLGQALAIARLALEEKELWLAAAALGQAAALVKAGKFYTEGHKVKNLNGSLSIALETLAELQPGEKGGEFEAAGRALQGFFHFMHGAHEPAPCNCEAYPFPHRPGGGRCEGE